MRFVLLLVRRRRRRIKSVFCLMFSDKCVRSTRSKTTMIHSRKIRNISQELSRRFRFIPSSSHVPFTILSVELVSYTFAIYRGQVIVKSATGPVYLIKGQKRKWRFFSLFLLDLCSSRYFSWRRSELILGITKSLFKIQVLTGHWKL